MMLVGREPAGHELAAAQVADRVFVEDLGRASERVGAMEIQGVAAAVAQAKIRWLGSVQGFTIGSEAQMFSHQAETPIWQSDSRKA